MGIWYVWIFVCVCVSFWSERTWDNIQWESLGGRNKTILKSPLG